MRRASSANLSPTFSVLAINSRTLANQAALVGQPYTLAASSVEAAFRDVDANTTLTFSATGLPAGLSIDSASGAISGTASAATNTQVTLTASDGSLSATQSFSFSVADHAPYSLFIGVATGPITDALNLQVRKASGAVLQYTTDPQGNLVVVVTDGYVGAVLITVSSNADVN